MEHNLRYWASAETASGQKQFVVVNHRPTTASYSVGSSDFDHVLFTRDGRSTVHRGFRSEQQFYVIAGKTQPAFSEVADFVYSPNYRAFAYVAHDNDAAFIVSPLFAGGRSPSFEAAWTPVFSPDGLSLAYTTAVGLMNKIYERGRTKFGVRWSDVAGPLVDELPAESVPFFPPTDHNLFTVPRSVGNCGERQSRSGDEAS